MFSLSHRLRLLPIIFKSLSHRPYTYRIIFGGSVPSNLRPISQVFTIYYSKKIPSWVLSQFMPLSQALFIHIYRSNFHKQVFKPLIDGSTTNWSPRILSYIYGPKSYLLVINMIFDITPILSDSCSSCGSLAYIGLVLLLSTCPALPSP